MDGWTDRWADVIVTSHIDITHYTIKKIKLCLHELRKGKCLTSESCEFCIDFSFSCQQMQVNVSEH